MSGHDGRGLVRWSLRALSGAVLVVAVVVAGTAVRVWYQARVDDRAPADVIVVLGAAQYNGTPSEVFKSRLAHAKRLYDADVAPVVITTGGKRDTDVFTEAAAGMRWLVEQGVPESAIISIGEGTDTLSTIDAVAETISSRGMETAVLVSDPWHSLRSQVMARDAGLTVWTSPTRSGPVVQTREIQARYIWRETKALLYYRLSKAPADDVVGAGLG